MAQELVRQFMPHYKGQLVIVGNQEKQTQVYLQRSFAIARGIWRCRPVYEHPNLRKRVGRPTALHPLQNGIAAGKVCGIGYNAIAFQLGCKGFVSPLNKFLVNALSGLAAILVWGFAGSYCSGFFCIGGTA